MKLFGGNLLAGDVHSSLTIDRQISISRIGCISLLIEVYSGHLPAYLRPTEVESAFSYYHIFLLQKTKASIKQGYHIIIFLFATLSVSYS